MHPNVMFIDDYIHKYKSLFLKCAILRDSRQSKLHNVYNTVLDPHQRDNISMQWETHPKPIPQYQCLFKNTIYTTYKANIAVQILA